MKSKYRFRRILSGVMAAVTILSTVISPLTVYASEEPKAAEPPAYESVKNQLDENEVVKATDLELEVGQTLMFPRILQIWKSRTKAKSK